MWRGGPHLRGANVHLRRVYPEIDGADFFGPGPFGPPATQQDFDRLAASGANYVELSHPGIFAEGAPYVLDVGALANLDRLLNFAAQADLYAVIAFRTEPGRSEFTFHPGEEDTWFPGDLVNNAVWTDDDAKQGWVDMWAFAAQRYRNSGIVVGYELMVEPNGATTGLRGDSPGEFVEQHSGGPYDRGDFFPRILEGIREVDARTARRAIARHRSSDHRVPSPERS